MGKRTLVTGGGGFLGSHLCGALVEQGHDVICLDNFSSGRQSNIEHLLDRDSFEVINHNIRLPHPLPEVDQIYHLASRASPSDFTEYSVDIALANTKGTRRMLDHARACGATMLYASTSEVYGDPLVHPQTEDYNGNVNIRGTRGCYDESKRFGETLTVAYNDQFDVDVRTARIFNTYGPRMRPDDGRVIPTFVTQAQEGRDLTVYGDGSQTRSFCYVDDLIRGLQRLMEAEGLAGDVVNLGNDNEMSIKELAKTIIEQTDTESTITHEPLPDDDPARRCPDLNRAKERLDWQPEVDLTEGLGRTIEHFRTSATVEAE